MCGANTAARKGYVICYVAMANKAPYKSISIKPVDGLLDTRLTPDEVALNGYRWVESYECLERGKLCRMSGYRRFLDTEFSNNADAHDQLLSVTGRTIRQPVIFTHEHEMASGSRKFFWGTANFLAALNNSTGNYKIIGDNFSPPETSYSPDVRWTAAGFSDVVVFTNGVDEAVWHVVDQPANDNGQSVQPIDDLRLLNITRVGFVKQWAGLTFYFNVVQDGVRQSYRVLWSDYQNPLSVKPKASASVAGRKDLDYGEVVLNAAEIGNSLLVYTNKGVWKADIDTTNGVSWTKFYNASREGDRCLKFPRWLISTGAEHYLGANDGIYVMSLYVDKPQRVEWIHKASATMYNDLDTSRCLVHCAGHEVNKKQLWFSWARNGEATPQNSLVLNTEYPFASYVPHGFTAFGNFGFTRQQSVRDFLLSRCICTQAGLDAAGLGFDHEGGYCDPTLEVINNSGCVNSPPTSIWTNQSVDLDGVPVEDFSKPQDPQSLCAQLSGLTLADLCRAEDDAGECRPTELFVMADANDFCLKQTDPGIAYRERCTDFSGCGTYVKDGYRSILRSGPIDLGLPEIEKILQRFAIEAAPVEQTIPSQIRLKVGTAAQALDPNKADLDSNCVILYQEQPLMDLVCQSTKTARQHLAANTRPDEDIAWPMWYPGRFLYYELTVVNEKVNPQDTGGLVCLSRFTFRVLVRGAGRL